MREELPFVADLARRAGEVLLAHHSPTGRPEIVDRKGQVRNLLTAADKASEDLVVAELRRAFPRDGIEAEESGVHPGVSGRVWCVDPLDGTVNFAHGHPFFAVSIGLFEGGRPVLGVVHAPVLRETFTGAVGAGAFLNGEPLRVSATAELIEAMLATGFAYVRNETEDHNVDNFAKLVFACRCVRRCGAASLDLSYVAAGRYDGFWEMHLAPWDVAAGAAILRAAGGTVTDFRGGEDFLRGRNVVATNGRLHEVLRGSLAPLRAL